MVAARQHFVPCVLLWALLLCGQGASGEVVVNVTVNNVNPEVPAVDFVQVVSQAYVVQQVNDSTAFTFTECPVGYYCESADGVPIPCPGGTYQPAIGRHPGQAEAVTGQRFLPVIGSGSLKLWSIVFCQT